MEELKIWLAQPVDAAPLALFRFLFGTTIFLFVISRFRSWHEYYTSSPFYFHYEITPFIRPCGKIGMFLILATNAIALLFFALGLLYPISAAIAFLTYTYIFLCDKSCYVNHFYLTALLLFLFCFTGGDRALSLDHVLFQTEEGTIPYWNILIFQLQIAIVYTYAGLNKINRDWLVCGQSLRSVMTTFEGTTSLKGWSIHHYCFNETIAASLKKWFRSDRVITAACWYSMFLDLTIIWMLLIPATHWFSVPLYLTFTFFNQWFFNISTFPYINYAALLLFLSPQFSRTIINWIGG